MKTMTAGGDARAWKDRGSSAPLARSVALWLARLVSLMWLFAGLTKIWGAAAHAIEEPAAILAPSVLQQPDWARTFPIALLAFVATLEIIAGRLVLIGREARGLLIGVALFALFTGAMIAWPIPPETPCGCAGPSFELPGSPLSRLALLGGLHAFALAGLTRAPIADR